MLLERVQGLRLSPSHVLQLVHVHARRVQQGNGPVPEADLRTMHASVGLVDVLNVRFDGRESRRFPVGLRLLPVLPQHGQFDQ